MRLLSLVILASATTGNAQESVAFLGLTLIDGPLEARQPDEQERLEMLEQMVSERFAEEGYDLVDVEPARADIDRVANIAKCNGCDTRIATKLGADFSLVGEVHKTSNLIIALNLQMRAAETGEMVKGAVVDIRGNTDEDWQRGMRYILKNRFFVEEAN